MRSSCCLRTLVLLACTILGVFHSGKFSYNCHILEFVLRCFEPVSARTVRLGLKWALRRAQNIFMPKSINSINYSWYTFGGHCEDKKWKKHDNKLKQSEEYFFQQRCRKKATRHWNGFLILISSLYRAIIWFSHFIDLLQRAKIHETELNQKKLNLDEIT